MFLKNYCSVLMYLDGTWMWDGRMHQVPSVGDQVKLDNLPYFVVKSITWYPITNEVVVNLLPAKDQ